MKRDQATKRLCGLILALLPLAAWAALSSPTPEPAKPAVEKPAFFDERAVADFYQGKSIQMIVGHDAGGGFDTYSRAIARHLGNKGVRLTFLLVSCFRKRSKRFA